MLLGNIDKGLATTIVLIVAGVLEGLLLLALLSNLHKKAKASKTRKQAMNMFDNTPTTSSYDFSYQEQTPTPDASLNNNYDNSMNQDMTAIAAMDSGIPSMDYNQDMTASTDYNQDSTFDSDNLMDMQMNDTLNIQDNNMNYDEPTADTNNEYNNYDNGIVGEPSFGSLEDQPAIINDVNNDPLPMQDELGSNPDEIVEPLDNNLDNMNIGMSDMNTGLDNAVPEMSYDAPIDQPTDINMDMPDMNTGLDNAVPEMSYDAPIDQPTDVNMDMPDMNTGLDNVVPEMSYDTPVEQPTDINMETPDMNTGLDNAVPEMNYDTSVDPNANPYPLEVPGSEDV